MSSDTPKVGGGGFIADTINNGVSAPFGAFSGDSDARSRGLSVLGTGGLLPGAKGLFDFSFGGKTPDAAAPPAPPTQAQATGFGLASTISREQQMAAANTIQTGGSGLLDEPTTASRVLLGS